MSARPAWKLPEPDPRPGRYYTSAIYSGRYAFLSGPFTFHADALADLPRAKAAALACGDPKAEFAAYGTCHLEGTDTPRVFFPKTDAPAAPPVPEQPVAFVKVRERGAKRFAFLTSKGGTVALRIHAARFRGLEHARAWIAANSAENPNLEFRAVLA